MNKSYYPLSDIEVPLRAALERLAESPRELRCHVIVQDPLTKRFVQFCTPPPASPFRGGERICCDEGKPLIFDGHGNGKPGGYVKIQECCTVDVALSSGCGNLGSYLPESALLQIIEESAQMERPS